MTDTAEIEMLAESNGVVPELDTVTVTADVAAFLRLVVDGLTLSAGAEDLVETATLIGKAKHQLG